MENRRNLTVVAALAVCMALVTGCRTEEPPATGADESAGAGSFIGRQVARGIAKAERKLETENIPVGDGIRIGGIGGIEGIGRRTAGDAPRAEITPDGALLIDGEEVPASAEQRALVQAYRSELVGVAKAGMAVGAEGADVAGTALTGIGQALFGGEEGRKAYEESIKAETARIEAEAQKLCALLPSLYESQQALAAAMPEFAPYATMTPKSIEDCDMDAGADPDAGITI